MRRCQSCTARSELHHASQRELNIRVQIPHERHREQHGNAQRAQQRHPAVQLYLLVAAGAPRHGGVYPARPQRREQRPALHACPQHGAQLPVPGVLHAPHAVQRLQRRLCSLGAHAAQSIPLTLSVISNAYASFAAFFRRRYSLKDMYEQGRHITGTWNRNIQLSVSMP